MSGQSGTGRILNPCEGCGRYGLRNAGHDRCAMCYARERRMDPEQQEKDRASSRAWKAKHRGHDRRPRPQKRAPAKRNPPAVSRDLLACTNCGIQLIDPDPLCGFCLIELPSYDKLRIMESWPGQDEEWFRYFSLLSDQELCELIEQAKIEQTRRLAAWGRRAQEKNTELYGSTPPAHHRRSDAAA